MFFDILAKYLLIEVITKSGIDPGIESTRILYQNVQKHPVHLPRIQIIAFEAIHITFLQHFNFKFNPIEIQNTYKLHRERRQWNARSL